MRVDLIKNKIFLTLMGLPNLPLPHLSPYSKPELLSNSGLGTLQCWQCYQSLCSEIVGKVIWSFVSGSELTPGVSNAR